ncbi:procathepsin L-like [Bradysia coprophila]|uniref:procathepsin L-like n=1 Tax=Bradysia coprophila TaxID=38358 RepID=UPI00187D9965|nr:procathepsin L-like [Bradysia coprophila]
MSSFEVVPCKSQQHSKVYKSQQEERYRNKIFLKNKLETIQHNSLYELGQVFFKLGLNEYSDLDHSEFVARMNGGFNSSIIQFQSEAVTYIVPNSNVLVPSSVDWTTSGAVTPVKNQSPGSQQCNSCWAFAATGALEGQHFRKTQSLISLSEQNLIDCSLEFGNHGCRGGGVSNAYQYIIANGGIETEQSYPYEARDAECRYRVDHNSGATVRAFAAVRQGDENALKMAVATTGPVAIAFDASLSSFHSYSSDVYYDPKCNPQHLTHAALVTGYGTTQSGIDYWIVKNSWGTSWGQGGYFFLARNRSNHCGVASAGIYPLV